MSGDHAISEWSAVSDEDIISPYKANTFSSRKVMRVKKITNQEISS